MLFSSYLILIIVRISLAVTYLWLGTYRTVAVLLFYEIH